LRFNEWIQTREPEKQLIWEPLSFRPGPERKESSFTSIAMDIQSSLVTAELGGCLSATMASQTVVMGGTGPHWRVLPPFKKNH